MKNPGNPVIRIIFAALAVLVIVYFYPHPEANRYKYEEGRPWNYAKLIAPFDIPIKLDSASVSRAKDSLDANFVPAFYRVKGVGDSVVSMLRKATSQNRHSFITNENHHRFQMRLVNYMRQAYSGDVMTGKYGERIAAGNLPSIRIVNGNTSTVISTGSINYPEKIGQELAGIFGDTLSGQWIRQYDIMAMLRPNVVYDMEKSRQLYDYELNRITAVKGVIQQGQTIIDKGAVITPQDYTNLSTYESMVEAQLSSEDQSDWLMLLGQFFYVVLLVGSLMFYLRFHSPAVWAKKSAMLFVLSLTVLFVLLGMGMDHFIDSGIYVVPFTIVPILLLVFFDGRTALFVSSVLIMLCGGIATFPLEFIFLQTCASAAAVYSLKELSQRSQLLRTAMSVAVAYWVSYVSLELLMNGSFDGFSWRMIVYLSVNAILTSMAYILMFAVERVFGFVSVVTLVELSDVNNPLLRKLSDECPGTFQHSMAVSTLAADAASRIGGNVQLIRAGALYHDIGKLNNPAFFTENQHGVNPHDSLPPQRSAEIIISHVSDGLRRADKAGLPAVIKDFISQHHGSGKAKYFYFTYCRQHPEETVDPAPFTYPGPNPKTRETSVLMMADSVEAASRSLKEHTPQAISDLVDKIIDGQIADGLHNDSPIAFRDIRIIKDAFVKRLMTMYHSRVTYPDDPTKKRDNAQ